MFKLSPALLGIALAVTSSAAFSSDGPALTIVAKPGKVQCRSKDQTINGAALAVELCVGEGSFSHDTYQVKIGGRAVLTGIDDQTTKGLVAAYQGEEVRLTCTPELEAPSEISPEEIAAVRKHNPELSEAQARGVVMRISSVEVGRACVAKLAGRTVLEVQIKFE